MTFDPEQEARKHGQHHAADLGDPASRKWLEDNRVRYVLPWRMEDEASLTSLLREAMEAERRRHNELFAAAEDMVRMRPNSFKRLTDAVCEAAIFRTDAIRDRGKP